MIPAVADNATGTAGLLQLALSPGLIRRQVYEEAL
ncbi:hypothetical protein FHR94_001154 [Halomonas cerina]|uniref:Uncharacterized protein n=1 Tax=Halomonas cerina TaxID=447424 RepID=A0A839V7I0_9GAMM|nr:hypothetical protein [Halomonas cerina]